MKIVYIAHPIGAKTKEGIEQNLTDLRRIVRKINLSWSVDCSLWDAPGFPKDGEPGLIHHYTEAECRAELLIILLENKLITVEEVNARLCVEQ